jgi:hypothetical protein
LTDLPVLFVQYGLYAWLLLLALVLFLLVRQSALQRRLNLLYQRYNNLTRGDDGISLLEALDRHLVEVGDLRLKIDSVIADSRELKDGLQLSLRHVGFIRFNPFDDTGGDQSFALALLDDHGDGVVISSLFGRTESRIFAKPVKDGRSRYTLTTEEEQAICQASLTR